MSCFHSVFTHPLAPSRQGRGKRLLQEALGKGFQLRPQCGRNYVCKRFTCFPPPLKRGIEGDFIYGLISNYERAAFAI